MHPRFLIFAYIFIFNYRTMYCRVQCKNRLECSAISETVMFMQQSFNYFPIENEDASYFFTINYTIYVKCVLKE